MQNMQTYIIMLNYISSFLKIYVPITTLFRTKTHRNSTDITVLLYIRTSNRCSAWNSGFSSLQGALMHCTYKTMHITDNGKQIWQLYRRLLSSVTKVIWQICTVSNYRVFFIFSFTFRASTSCRMCIPDVTNGYWYKKLLELILWTAEEQTFNLT